jgi:hypothetical protein
MTELEVRAGDELERQLARYGRVRLDPSPAQAKRARSAVMEAAWRRRLQGVDGGLVPEAVSAVVGRESHRRAPFGAWGPRRLAGSLAAAVLAGLLVGSSVFAASRAGGPLYGARLGLEELMLPVEPASRVEAVLAGAQTRLAEIVDAVTRRDDIALAAAVGAYDASVAELAGLTGSEADRALEVITYHQAVLLETLARAPEAAQAGLANALEQSGSVVSRLDAASAAPGVGSGGAQGGGAQGGGAGAGGAQGGGAGAGGAQGGGAGAGAGKPSTEPVAAPTAKPTKPPKPTIEPAAPSTPKPGGGQSSGGGSDHRP